LIEAVIFDLDGTLIQLPIDYEKLFQEFKMIMRVDEVRPLVDTVSRVDEKTRKRVFRAWDNAELAVSERVVANEEGMKIYETYVHKPKALVTLQGKRMVKIVLERFRLSFDVVVTREDTLKRDEQLGKAAEKLKASFQSLLFVGNTENDSVAAEKVGCQFLRVRS